ncbi:MAG: hypothetical protein ACRBFS_18320 [Aureispira sp.]
MDIIRKKKAAYFYLLLASLATFFIWSYEIEYHGWKGLIWLTYFHKAIPICFFLFVAWFATFVEAETRKLKGLYLLLLVVIGSCMIIATVFILYFLFGFGGKVPTWMVCFFIYPFLLFSILQRFGFYIPVFYIRLAQLLFSGAPFLCVELVGIFSSQGTADTIHIFKTGYIYPFWFFAIGFPLIYCQKRQMIREGGEEDILDAP